MSCCGRKRQQVVSNIHVVSYPPSGSQESAAARSPAPGGGVLFVYDGMAELVVTGSVTGRRYRFAARGARLAVAPADAPAMALLPRLRRLSA